MTINWQSGIPAYDQIVQGFIKLRALGAMAPDEKLPSVRVMANNLGVNPNTVQKAYLILEEKGIIYSVAGKGSFISGSDRGTKAVFEAAKSSLEKAVTEALSLGLTKEDITEILNIICQKGGTKND